MVLGGIAAAFFTGFSVYHAFVITGELASVPRDLMMSVLVGIILLLPAFALYSKKNTGIILSKIGILYPILVAGGFINILRSEDALAAGMPMVLLVMPFCIVYGLVVLVKKN